MNKFQIRQIWLLPILLTACQLPNQANISSSQTSLSGSGAPNVHYKYSGYVFPKGQAIEPLAPSNDGGIIRSCTILPSISDTGLQFGASNCQLSGTPLKPGGMDQFMITAYNAEGSSQAVITITYTNPAPPQTAGDPAITIVGGYGDSDSLHPTLVPPGTKMSSLTLDKGAYVVIQDVVNIDTIIIKGNSTLVVNVPNTFGYLSVDYGRIVSTNGALNMRITEMLSVSTSGELTADGRAGAPTCDGSQNGGQINIVANAFENNGLISANSLSPDPNSCDASGGNISLSIADIFLIGHIQALGANGKIGTLAINVIDRFN